MQKPFKSLHLGFKQQEIMKRTLLLLSLMAGFAGVSQAQETITPDVLDRGIPTNIVRTPKAIKYSARVANNVNARMSHTDAVVLGFSGGNPTSAFGNSSFIDFYTDTLMRINFGGQIARTGFNGVGGMLNPYHFFFDEPVSVGQPYRLDTVWVGGIYTRIQNNNVGDTLRVQVSFGPSTALGNGPTSGAPWVALRFNATAPAPIANRAVVGQIYSGNPAHGFGGTLSASAVTINYVLTAADTVSTNPNYPYIPIVMPNGGLQIPANNWVGVNAMYRTGNPYSAGDLYWTNVTDSVGIHNTYRPLAWVESASPAAHVFMLDSTGLSFTLTRVARYGTNPGSFWSSPRTDRGYWIDFSINYNSTVSVRGIDANVARIGNVYPNPVNAGNTMVLPVQLKRSSRVNYNITNYLGQQVAVEQLGLLNEGEHRLEVATSQLNAGIYFLNIQVDGASQAVRFVVNK